MVVTSQCVLYLSCLMQFSISPTRAENIAKYVCRYNSDIDDHIILAIMFNESRFKQTAKSETFDYGVLQLHCPPHIKWWLCNQCNVKKLECNIRQGIKWLHHLKTKYYWSPKPFTWIQYYNFHSKGYSKRIQKIRANLVEYGNVICKR